MLDDGSLDTIAQQRISSHESAGSAFAAWSERPDAGERASHEFGAMLDLRQLADPDAQGSGDAEAWHLPPPGIHTTGSQLRRRLVTAESIAELAAQEKPSLLRRLMRRK